MTPTNYYYNDEAVNKQTAAINVTSPPGPSLNMRRNFLVPSTLLQKPYTNPSQFGNMHGVDAPEAGPFLQRALNMDLSRLSLHSQSAHRVNGAPILLQKQPEQVFNGEPGQHAMASPPMSPDDNVANQTALKQQPAANRGGAIRMVNRKYSGLN